jgi:hypothetical protein
MPTKSYATLLAIHSDLRWLLILAGIGAVTVALIGVFKKVSLVPLGRVSGLIYVSILDTQVLLGILLYVPSPYVKEFWSHPASAIKLHDPRFFAVEHVVMMLVALALAHIGAVQSRRACKSRVACGTGLMWYGISLLVILAAIPWWRPMLRL